MAQKWKKNPAVHPVDLDFSGDAQENRRVFKFRADGGFGADPAQTGDPENKAGQAYADALFDGSNLPGIDVRTGHGVDSKHSGEYADADRPHREVQNKLGTKRARYGFGVADDERLKGKR